MKEPFRNLGPYVLLGELGEGAMGTVFQARHAGLNRSVALKVMRAGVLAGQEARHRFRTEAEAGAALEHPHIVPVYEVGDVNGVLYLAMKLLPGGTLAERLAEGRMPVREAATLIRAIADAVAFAHRRGVLHRDLKPGNILLDASGQPRLSDFGLAKFLGSDTALTLTQAVLGTPAYMAPEVARHGAKAATTQSDLWSLGAILYELLSGKPPFPGEGVHEILRQVAEGNVAPLGNSNAPRADGTTDVGERDLRLICLKCLRREPEQRYRSVEALVNDLDCWLGGAPISVRPPRTAEVLREWYRRHRGLAWGGAGIALSLALGFGTTLWQLRESRRHFEASQQANETLRRTNLRLRLANTEETFSQDRRSSGLLELAEMLRSHPGDSLVATRLWSALRMRRFAWSLHAPLLSPGGDGETYEARFSSDGSRLAVSGVEPERLDLWEVATARHLGQVPHNPEIFALAVDAGLSRALVTQTNGGCGVWDLRSVQRLPGPWDSMRDLTSGAMHLGGGWAAAGSKLGEVYVWDLKKGEIAMQTRLKGPVRALAWHPGEPVLACADADHRVQFLHAAAGSASGLNESSPGGIGTLAFSGDGRWLLLTGTNRVEAWRWGETIQRGKAGRFNEVVTSARLSFDGDRFAVATRSGRVAVYDSRTGVKTRFERRLPSIADSVRFGPADEFLAVAGRDGLVRLLYGDRAQPLFEPIEQPIFAYDVAFGAGGLLATVGADHLTRLWFIGIPGFAQSRAWEVNDCRAAELSPDGLAFMTVDSKGGYHVRGIEDSREIERGTVGISGARAIRQSRSGKWRFVFGTLEAALFEAGKTEPLGVLKSTNTIVHATFDRAERHLAVGVGGQVEVYDLAAGTLKLRGVIPVQGDVMLEFSPDGERLLMAGSRSWGADLWSVALMERIGVRMQHQGPITVACFSPDGRWIATGGQDRKPRIWSGRDGTSMRPPLDHETEITALAFSHSGDELLSGGADGLVTRWIVPSGAAKGEALRPGGMILSIEPSSDGRWILIATSKQVGLWDAETGLRASDWLHAANGARARFSLDEGSALIQTPGGVRVWRLPSKDRPPDQALIALAQWAANRHLDESGAALPFHPDTLNQVQEVGRPTLERVVPAHVVHVRLRRTDGAPAEVEDEFPAEP